MTKVLERASQRKVREMLSSSSSSSSSPLLLLRIDSSRLASCSSSPSCSRRGRRYHQQRSVVGATRASSSPSSSSSSRFNPGAIFNEIFCDDETFSKSRSRAIAKRVTELNPETYKHPEDSFYGEIDVNSMLELIDLGTDGGRRKSSVEGVEGEGGGLRYADLGCGVGKQVAAAALSGKFSKAVGVEICPDLAAKAIEGIGMLREELEKYSSGVARCEISVSQGDMFDQDLSQFDFIFVHATTLHDTTLGMLKAKLSREMNVGARLAIVSKLCDDIENFEPLRSIPGGIGWKPILQVDEKWQLDCYLYEKTKELD